MKISGNKKKLFEKVFETIQDNDNFLIVTHDFPDGDCLGSQVALYELLRTMGKNVRMLCSDEIPYQYKFLPGINEIKKDLDAIIPGPKKKDYVCFCLDSSDEGRFETGMNMLMQIAKTIINIDHHPGNTGYGDINIIFPQKSATAEILYEFMDHHFRKYLNYNIALGIYTGILTDTGKFQYENTTHNVHNIISHLLELGVVPSDVFSFIYENEPFNRFKLLELVLKRIKMIWPKKLIYSYVLRDDFKKLSVPFSANDGVIDLLRSASEARVAALFKEVGYKKYKVSLRSSKNGCRVDEIASKFGGGGHKQAAAYSCEGNLKELISDLVRVID